MKKTILLIEEDRNVRDNITEILELANFIVFTAENGKEGVDLAKTTIPNIIICNILMSKLDGYAVLQIVSNNPELEHIPFIFLTEKADSDDLRKCMELGADDYLSIPFEESKLLRAIESRLKRSEAYKHKTKKFTTKKNSIQQIKNINDLLLKKTIYTYKKNESIYCKGNLSNHIFLIKKGEVKTYKVNEQGKEFITGYYNKKQYFGYTSFVKHTSHFENSKAITNVKLYKISKREITTLINGNPEIINEFIDLMAGDLIEIKEQLILLAYASVRKKTARTLLNLLSKLPLSSDEGYLKISRSNLANSIGIGYETLIRTLHDFKEEQLIKINDKGLKIVNKKKLLNTQ